MLSVVLQSIILRKIGNSERIRREEIPMKHKHQAICCRLRSLTGIWGLKWTERLGPPIKFIVEIWATRVILLGRRAFRRWSSYDGRTHVNGISVLIKETLGTWFTLASMWGHSKNVLSMNQQTGPHQTVTLPVPWSWTSQPPDLWEINVCHL
jgi:hypothetical protein